MRVSRILIILWIVSGLYNDNLNMDNLSKKRITPARVAFTEIETTLRRFFMRVTCRGFAGRQDKAQDISDYFSKGGSNV